MCIKVSGQFTIYFEDPFWVGVFELIYKDKISIYKVMFGSEPKDYEVYEFIMKNYYYLKFSKPIPIDKKSFYQKKINPKRLQRAINKQTNEIGIGTKAQQALKLEYESNKLKRKKDSRKQKELEKQLKYVKKQEKKKLKKRGH